MTKEIKLSNLEQKFKDWLDLEGLTGYTMQYMPQLKGRKWRIDFAWVDWKIAVEIQGINYVTGFGHQTPDQMIRDYEKINTLTAHGWKVFLFLGRGDTGESHYELKRTIKSSLN